jgi:hypothetical protein
MWPHGPGSVHGCGPGRGHLGLETTGHQPPPSMCCSLPLALGGLANLSVGSGFTTWEQNKCLGGGHAHTGPSAVSPLLLLPLGDRPENILKKSPLYLCCFQTDYDDNNKKIQSKTESPCPNALPPNWLWSHRPPPGPGRRTWDPQQLRWEEAWGVLFTNKVR